MRCAEFTIEKETPEYVFIIDTGPWDEHPTVTNDAENVVETLARDHTLGSRRLFYMDSEQQIDELKHNGGQYTGFSFGHSGITL